MIFYYFFVAIIAFISDITESASADCSQTKVEKALGSSWSKPSDPLYYIRPNKDVSITPMYDWQSNNGYCGETSFMSAGGMKGGTWMSQYNTRLVCGSGLSQSGTSGNCDTNAELLLEYPTTGVR